MIAVGHGWATIDTHPGEPMGGYADRVGGVSGELDPLEAHVLTIADGRQRFALVVLDVVCVNVDLVAAIRTSVDGGEAPVDRCWVSATHTHAGPETGCFAGGSSTPPDLAARLLQVVRDALADAIAHEQPASAAALRVRVDGLAGRRASDPMSPVSIPVDRVRFTSPDGAVLGVLVNVPVHPTVLPATNTLVSSDLVGGIRRAIGTELGIGAAQPWVVVTTGAAGDISTRHTRAERTTLAIRALGARVARSLSIGSATQPLWTSGDTDIIEYRSGPLTLEPKSADDIPIPSDAEPDEAEPEGVGPDDTGPDRAGAPGSARAAADLGGQAHPAVAAAGATAEPPVLTRRTDGARRTELTRRQGIAIAKGLLAQAERPPYRIELSAVKIGALTLVAVPGELFLALGESIRQQAGAQDPVIVLGYTNGYLGYLPRTEDFASPSYETFASPVRKGSGELIRDAAVGLVLQLAGARPPGVTSGVGTGIGISIGTGTGTGTSSRSLANGDDTSIANPASGVEPRTDALSTQPNS